MSLSSPPLARVASAPSAGSQELRPALHERIAELTIRLRSEHDRYERAAQSWTDEAAEDKRQARKAREVTLHEIEALLTHNGEVDRLARLERLPFARKLPELEAWIEVRPAVQEERPLAVPEARRVATPAAAPLHALAYVQQARASFLRHGGRPPARAWGFCLKNIGKVLRYLQRRHAFAATQLGFANQGVFRPADGEWELRTY